MQAIPDMFQQTNRKELGDMIYFLRDLAEALRQTYTNGRPPILGDASYDSERKDIRRAVRSVLEKLASLAPSPRPSSSPRRVRKRRFP
jgi:hypothetical protein